MDIQKLITEVLGKLNVDASLVEKFKKDPIATVKSLLSSINLDETQLKAIVEGVTAKLNLDDTVKDAGGIIDKIKGIFGK